MRSDWGEHARRLTDHVTVLSTPDNGAYPSGNTLLVEGAGETVIIDPSVTVVEKGGAGVPVDAVINSHGHEDHIAGNCVFPHARVHIHHDDIEVTRSIDALMALTESTPQNHPELHRQYLEEFHYQARPDAEGYGDGQVWDLGGVSVEAVHLPGHTAGHCGLRISEGVFFLSDIDLTGFGPYYGDVFSSLEQFEQSLIRVRDEEADVYVTFHHKGVIEGRDTFVEMLDAFHAVIDRRHTAMLDYLAEPHTIAEMVDHRFVYRPHVEMPIVDRVERRTSELHVARMLERGEAIEVEPGRYRAA
jgi:glyoxylase-like metal-dependent hydrolase (beta-lactamase superfamily II)